MLRVAMFATALSCAAGAAFAQVVPPTAVPGKEYISEPNIDQFGFPVAGQVLAWDGLGNVANGALFPNFQLDAIANHGDAYLPDLIADQAAMVLSFRKPTAPGHGIDVAGPGGPGGPRAALWYHESTPYGSGSGVWATTAQVDNINRPENVFGVEVWGPSNDTDVFSEVGDVGGIAAWSTAGGGPAPYLFTGQVSAAIGVPGLNVDIDALMVNDSGVVGRFDIGDTVLFSVAPNPVFDGGEIWVMTMTAGGPVAAFLFQGGILWDTAHSVSATFGIDTENIDALEAMVPTPGSVGLLGLAALGATRRRRR